MVAPKADDLIRRPCLEVDQEVDNAATIRPPIDVVAEENKLNLLGSSVSLAKFNETLKLAQASVNVAKGVGDAQSDSFVLEHCRTPYNTNRPHTSLNGLTPTEFATRPKQGQSQNRLSLNEGNQ